MDERYTYTIDHIEAGFAQLECGQTLETLTLPLTALPKNIAPGHTLRMVGGFWEIDHQETSARAARIAERFARIRGRGRR